MAQPKRPEITDKDVTGLKYFDKLGPLLERLHGIGCQRDAAGNRTLHFDQYCMLVLLLLFHPIVTSLRALVQASELKKVQKQLGCARSSLGSLSESVAVFEPERLKEIIDALPKMAEASLLKSQTGRASVKWRRHTHFEVERYLPTRIDVTPEAGGDSDNN